jgi:hypothetical protein
LTLVAVDDRSINKIHCDLGRSCYNATLVAVASLYSKSTTLRPWSQLLVFILNQQKNTATLVAVDDRSLINKNTATLVAVDDRSLNQQEHCYLGRSCWSLL